MRTSAMERELIDQARMLRELGATYEEIGRELHIDKKTAWIWLNPEGRERHNARTRRWQRRQQMVPGTRVSWATADRIVAMREADETVSYRAIRAALKVFDDIDLSTATIKKVLATVAPEHRPKTRGIAFNSDEDQRRAAQ